LALTLVVVVTVAAFLDSRRDDALPPLAIIGIEVQGLDDPAPRTAVARLQVRKLSPHALLTCR
jgi:hypothetical protein